MWYRTGVHGRVGVVIRTVPEDGRKLGRVKKEHIRIATDSKLVVASYRVWNSTTS